MVDASTLVGRYRLEERIAGGGMGTVYAASDELLGRRVAAKLLNENLADNPSFVDRFRREARSVAALVHPNIATVFDYGEEGGRHFIVMELVEGVDLDQVLKREGPLDPERARALAVQICEALGHAHATGLVHRDVKPANAIVTAEDVVKMTDFGIARVVGDDSLTAAGSVLGTAHYLSPEQASGGEVGPPSDVYSAGIVLFEMLTGEPPFKGNSPLSIAMRHVNEDVPRPSETRPGVPPDLDDVVARATSRDAGARFGNGGEMARALGARDVSPVTAVMGREAATRALPLTSPESTDEFAPRQWPPQGAARRRAGPILAVIALLVALAGAALAVVTFLDREREPAQRPAANASRERSTPSPSPAEEQLSVPDGLVGGNVADAEAVLGEMGLVPVRRAVADEAPADTVIAVSPPEGSPVSAGDTVTLTVSTGPAEPSPEPSPTTEPTASESDDEGEAD